MNQLLLVFLVLGRIEFGRSKQLEAEVGIEYLFGFAQRQEAPVFHVFIKAHAACFAVGASIPGRIQRELTHFFCTLQLLFELETVNGFIAVKVNFINFYFPAFIDINENGVGVDQVGVCFFIDQHPHILKSFIAIKLNRHLADIAADVFGDNCTLGQAYLALQFFCFRFFGADKFETTQACPLLHTDLYTYPVALYTGNIDLHTREQFLTPQVINSFCKNVAARVHETITGLKT